MSMNRAAAMAQATSNIAQREHAQAHYAARPDFVLANHGSILVLTPMTQEGKDWVAEHLPDDAQRWGRGVVIEPRYWEPIEAGIEESGLIYV